MRLSGTSVSASTRRATPIVLLVLSVLVLVVAYVCDPEQTRWFPKCIFHALTGYDCPTCGSTRALHHILHGRFATGLSYNPFIVISFPMLAGILYTSFFDNRVSRRLGRFFLNYITLIVFVALFIAWWIIRNII